MKIILLLVILLNTFFSLFGQNGTSVQKVITQFLDESSEETNIVIQKNLLITALELSEGEKEDSLWFETMDKLSNLNFHNSRPEVFKQNAQKFLIKAISLSNDRRIAEGNYKMGSYFLEISVYDSAYYHLNESTLIYKTLVDSIKVGANLLNMSIIRLNTGGYYDSERLSVEALKYLESSENTKLSHLVSTYNNLGIVNDELGLYAESVKWYKKSLELLTEPIEHLVILNNIGLVYRHQKDLKKAINYFRQAMLNNVSEDFPSYSAMVKDNLAYTSFLLGDESVFSDLIIALKERRKSKSKLGEIVSLRHLAEFELKIGNRSHAIVLAEQSLMLSDSIGDTKDALKALSFLAEHSNNSQYTSEYIRLSDSIIKVERTMANKFALIDFESGKKQKENLALTFENQKKDIQISDSKIRNTVLFFTVIFLGIIMLGFFFYYRQRQKINEKNIIINNLKARVEERNELSIQLHDDIASDLLLGLQRGEALYQKSKEKELNTTIQFFERAYDKMRKISQEISSIETTKISFEKQLRFLIKEMSFNASIIPHGLDAVNWIDIHSGVKHEVISLIREALVNVHKHANATEVQIQFEENKKDLMILVRDNGIGFQEEQKTGLGIEHMKKRLKNVGGELVIIANSPTGTIVKFIIPIN